MFVQESWEPSRSKRLALGSGVGRSTRTDDCPIRLPHKDESQTRVLEGGLRRQTVCVRRVWTIVNNKQNAPCSRLLSHADAGETDVLCNDTLFRDALASPNPAIHVSHFSVDSGLLFTLTVTCSASHARTRVVRTYASVPTVGLCCWRA